MDTRSDSVDVPKFDEDGLIIDPSCWSEEIAEITADRLHIQLGAEHWVAIYALRNYFTRFGVAPPISSICRNNGKDKHWIHRLFGSCLNAWRVAGLADPGEEAKSYLNDM